MEFFSGLEVATWLDDIGFKENQKALFATQVPGCCGCLLLDVVVFRQLYEQEVQKGF